MRIMIINHQHNLKKSIKTVYTVLFIFLIISSLFQTNMISSTNTNEINTIEKQATIIPKLEWHPKKYDFGYVQEGNSYQTTFEIWNNGTGSMEWNLDVHDAWITVQPQSGVSTGEHDIINVTITTTGLQLGFYEGNVYIHSAGDYIFYTSFIVSETVLDFLPKSYHFGTVERGGIYETTFTIWNNGTGILDWYLQPSQAWISVKPKEGQLMDTSQVIAVSVNTSIPSDNVTNGSVSIISTGGRDDFTISFLLNHPPEPPSIQGHTNGTTKDEQTFQICSMDKDADAVFYLCDWGDESDITWIGPYASGEQTSVNHTWDKWGTYSIKVKAKDINCAESDWANLEINIPKNKDTSSVFTRFLEQYPHLFPIVRYCRFITMGGVINEK